MLLRDMVEYQYDQHDQYLQIIRIIIIIAIRLAVIVVLLVDALGTINVMIGAPVQYDIKQTAQVNTEFKLKT